MSLLKGIESKVRKGRKEKETQQPRNSIPSYAFQNVGALHLILFTCGPGLAKENDTIEEEEKERKEKERKETEAGNKREGKEGAQACRRRQGGRFVRTIVKLTNYHNVCRDLSYFCIIHIRYNKIHKG